MADEAIDPYVDLSDEGLEVLRRRYTEARNAGLSIVEAKLFAESELVPAGCEPRLIAEIVI